jgi:predicted Zn-dependent protease
MRNWILGGAAFFIWAVLIAFMTHHMRSNFRRNQRIRGDERAALFPHSERQIAEIVAEFPTSPRAAIRHAQFPAERADWPEAARRCADVVRLFPKEEYGYLGASHALRQLGRLDEMEAVLAKGRRRLPASSGIAVAFARSAAAREDWKQADKRWADIRARFPGRREAYAEGAMTLRKLGNEAGADSLLAAVPPQ